VVHFEDHSNIIIQGCSGSGKTEICSKILRHGPDLFDTTPSLILFCYKSWQKIYDSLQKEMSNIRFLPNLPNEEELKDLVRGHDHSILVADDMLTEIAHSAFCSDLFLRLCHHLQITTILILQSGNLGTKFGSNLIKNCHYTILLRSPKDQYGVRSLGLQLADYKNLSAAYRDATREPFSYLLISSHPKSEDSLRYRTDIFPSDPLGICYIAPEQIGNSISC
jgi:hypothetical protein